VNTFGASAKRFTQLLSLSSKLEIKENIADATARFNEKTFDFIIVSAHQKHVPFLETLLSAKQTNYEDFVLIGVYEPEQKQNYKLDRYFDYHLSLDIDAEDLQELINNVRKKLLQRRTDKIKTIKEQAKIPYFGTSAVMNRLIDQARIGAQSDADILITGETGTGKGVLAKWIHRQSKQCDGPFVALNCSALSGELLKSELFGHAKGSFTSAHETRTGLIENANQGTLFLDEIGDMDVSLQAQLLKAIEEKQFRRLGENKIRHSDFRLITATNINLQEAIAQGSFRKDLFYRVGVFPLHLPALRNRVEDIEGYCNYFLTEKNYQHMPVDPGVRAMLKKHSWPGNIRELRNILERALLLAQGSPLKEKHFTGLIDVALDPTNLHMSDQLIDGTTLPGEPDTAAQAQTTSTNIWPLVDLDEVQKIHIHKVLSKVNNDKKEASSILGISVSTLYRKIQPD